jgi:hypothetical protein
MKVIKKGTEFTIDAGKAGQITASNILIRHVAFLLQQEGRNARVEGDVTFFDHPFDDLVSLGQESPSRIKVHS